MGDVIWRKYSPKTPQNGREAKTPKSLHRNISGTINPTNWQFEGGIQTTKQTQHD